MFRKVNIKSKCLNILSLFAGIVFLLSGIGKSVTVYDFSEILAQYGIESFRLLAPLIIVFEVVAGLLLFFHIKLKQTSLCALCFIFVLSLSHLCGYFFANITDCGCFGYLSFLNMSPLFTFIRNLSLMGVLLYIFLKSDNFYKLPDKSETIIITCILCVVCFVSGYSYVEHTGDISKYFGKWKNTDISVCNSVLGDFLNFSEDSTYFLFVFSYSCPHCYSSIENLKQYERLGVADRVLGITYTADSSTMGKFMEIFNPDFQIKNYQPEQLFRLTNRFPVSYYIKKNVIRMEIRGILPCGYFLLE